jgi:hypothetical protein
MKIHYEKQIKIALCMLIHFVLRTKGANIIRMELREFATENELRIRTFFRHKDNMNLHGVLAIAVSNLLYLAGNW